MKNAVLLTNGFHSPARMSIGEKKAEKQGIAPLFPLRLLTGISRNDSPAGNKTAAAKGKEKEKENDGFSMTIGGKEFTDRKEAGTALIAACAGLKAVHTSGQVGEYAGFSMSAAFDGFTQSYILTLKRQCSYTIEVGMDPVGNVHRIQNALNGIERQLTESQQKLGNLQAQLAAAKEEVKKPFAREAELAEKSARLTKLNAMLNMDEHAPSDVLGVDEETDQSISSASSRENRDGHVADCLPGASTFAERAGDLHASQAKGENPDKKENSREKPSLLGRLQEKKAEIASAAKPGPGFRARAEPAL